MGHERKTIPLARPEFSDEELRLLADCLKSRWVTQGPLVRRFEELFAQRHQVTYALATTSCTAALHMATIALGLGPGDEVVVPAFTWVTSAHCAEYVGAKAVFVDIDLDTFNLDPGALEAAISKRTRAVVVVHLFGLAAKLDEIMSIARQHSLWVIEDAACAIGTMYDGRPVGNRGDIGCFSFHPRKVITTGEGGMVTTGRESIARTVMSLRCHGDTIFAQPVAQRPAKPKPYDMNPYDILGYNLRLSDIQAAVGVAQMAKLDGLLAERQKKAEYYRACFHNTPEIVLPTAPPKCGHTYQSYVIRLREGGLKRRNQIMDFLGDQGIQTRPGTHAVHRLGYYREKYKLTPEMFPNACMGEDTTITLPLFPGMTDSDQDRVSRAVCHALQK